jgi:hypothetical protein
MAVEEARRRALRRAVAEALGEEVAETLMDLVSPHGQELATREDIRGVLDALSAMDDRWEGRFAAMEERLVGLEGRSEGRLATMEERSQGRFAALDERLVGMEHRLTSTFERRIADAVTMQTRTLVFSQLGALVVIAALAFGLR